MRLRLVYRSDLDLPPKKEKGRPKAARPVKVIPEIAKIYELSIGDRRPVPPYSRNIIGGALDDATPREEGVPPPCGRGRFVGQASPGRALRLPTNPPASRPRGRCPFKGSG